MKYLVKMPRLVQRWIYPDYTWQMPATDKTIYLTFDDGPHPSITPFVLDQLQQYKAKATFFCIGKNVAANPGIYKQILLDGHAVGNHTYDHLNGWKTDDATYFNNIAAAAKLIDSRLFRPPYGRVSGFQGKQLREKLDYKIIMWSVLSGDFDLKISGERCLKNVVRNAAPGAVIVFHDSEKANERMSFALPKVLEDLSNKGYVFEKLPH